MKKLALVSFVLIIAASQIHAAEGMLNVESQYSVEDTANRLETILNTKGMTIFNRIRPLCKR